MSKVSKPTYTENYWQYLKISKSVKIFKKFNNANKKKINAILIKAAGRESEILDLAIEKELFEKSDLKISYVIFKKTRKVGFLSAEISFEDNSLNDISHGFFILVQNHEYLAISHFKSNIPMELIEKIGNKIGFDEMANAKLSAEANLQKIRTKAMLNSMAGCHNRTFEGDSLHTGLSSLANHRQLVTSASFKNASTRTSMLFSQAKISDLGSRTDFEETVEWMASLLRDVKNNRPHNFRFMNTYAKEVSLPENIIATSVLVHDWELESYFDGDNGQWLDGSEIIDAAIFGLRLRTLLNSQFELFKIGDSDRYEIIVDIDEDNETIGTLTVEENRRIKLSIPTFRRYTFISLDDEEVTLEDLINNDHLFSVTLSDPRYYYANGTFVMDGNIIERTRQLLDVIVPIESLDPNITPHEFSKKVRGDKFPEDCIFHLIDETYRYLDDGLLVLDDGGLKNAEWADFIYFNDGKRDQEIPELTFYHAKADSTLKTGATPFHVVISQAIKNLGQLTRGVQDYIERYDSGWKDQQRFGAWRQRNFADIDERRSKEIISNVAANPRTIRKVSVVVNYLSKAELTKSLEAGVVLGEYQVQRIWLLNNFVSSCLELGLVPEILCAI